MAGDSLAFIYQLQGENYNSLASTNFKVSVTDPDDTQLTSSQIHSLEASGKTMYSYLSIGEAENYRSYWQSSWNSNPPSFLLGEDKSWPGDYNVKFWDPAWQHMIINEAVTMAKDGYNGVVLDVVDAYTVQSVANAYTGSGDARSAMMSFVEAISAATKAVNPNFHIIQNNALDLLTTDPNDGNSATNTAYMSHIDGVVAEDTFYNSDNTKTSWGTWNLQYLQHAVDSGKQVYSIDYPTNASAQQSYISQAVSHGFIPFVGTENLDSVPSVNYQVPGDLTSTLTTDLQHITDLTTGTLGLNSGTTTTTGTTTTGTATADPDPGTSTSSDSGSSGSGSVSSASSSSSGSSSDSSTTTAQSGAPHSGSGPTVSGHRTVIHGTDHADHLTGTGGNYVIRGAQGNDVITANGHGNLYGGAGHDTFVFNANSGTNTIHNFKTSGGSSDTIQISSSIYTNTHQVLSHIDYSNGNAVVHLDGGNSVTVLGVADHALTAKDFHIA
jgi:cysteinyl-tRNA synthetase